MSCTLTSLEVPQAFGRFKADAGRQKGVLAAIVELELHQRIFETDWRILPVSRQWE